jgi:hypothetical protein
MPGMRQCKPPGRIGFDVVPGKYWVEHSYSVFGERGRIDLLAWHNRTRTMLVIELKTEMGDAQALLGTLDVKTRLAPTIARELGQPRPALVVRMLIFRESMTNRRQVARLSTLFSSFNIRGSAALAWLHRPAAAGGLLIFSSAAVSSTRGVRQHRVRLGRPRLSTISAASSAEPGPTGASPLSNATGGSR